MPMPGQTSNMQDSRQTGTRDLPPHLSLRHNTANFTHPAQSQHNENKTVSAVEHPYPTWRAPKHPLESAERSVNTSSVTSASVSPPPSSSGSQACSVMGHVSSYPMMVPWMHPYHAYPYVMSYMPPYMAYPPHVMQPHPQAALDANGAHEDVYRAQQQAWASHGYKVRCLMGVYMKLTHNATVEAYDLPFCHSHGAEPILDVPRVGCNQRSPTSPTSSSV
jgi:hypothetical protein